MLPATAPEPYSAMPPGPFGAIPLRFLPRVRNAWDNRTNKEVVTDKVANVAMDVDNCVGEHPVAVNLQLLPLRAAMARRNRTLLMIEETAPKKRVKANDGREHAPASARACFAINNSESAF